MSEPEQTHSTEPAEGDNRPGEDPGGRTPHPQQPAEGGPVTEGGADRPDSA